MKKRAGGREGGCACIFDMEHILIHPHLINQQARFVLHPTANVGPPSVSRARKGYVCMYVCMYYSDIEQCVMLYET